MSMLTVTIGAVINIILDPIFIFKLGMGIKGAAVATSIAQFVSFAILFSHYLFKRSILKLWMTLYFQL